MTREATRHVRRAGRAPFARVVAPASVGLAVVACTLVVLNWMASYHGPLYGAVVAARPRSKALEDLDAWMARKRAEEARIAELLRTLDTPKMVLLGKELVHGRALCFNCHRIGSEGQGKVGPDLQDVGARAGTRVPDMTDVDYLAQSLYQPGTFVVPTFPQSMPPVNQPPIGLSDLEIRMVVAYLQSLGGTPTVEPNAKLPFAPGP